MFTLLSSAANPIVVLAPGGQGKVLQAFDYLRTVADEPKRFQMLVLSLTDEPVNPIYQVKKDSNHYCYASACGFFERNF